MVLFTTFVNGRMCIDGELLEGKQLVTSEETGLILKRTGYIGGEIVDLEDAIIAPGYLELQTNGMLGFHFTHFESKPQYSTQLEKVSKFLITKGVTGFWATLPTVAEAEYKKILPSLKPKSYADSADMLGCHAEGPFLQPSKKGAHNEDFFRIPDEKTLEQVYGEDSLKSSIKLVTLAPELSGACEHTSHLVKTYNIRVSLGHSGASYDEGQDAIDAGATALTHAFNAMNPLHHRSPGLVGLIAAPCSTLYFSLIPDGIHLHPALVAMAYRSNPSKCVLITDSTELAGLPDGDHPGHAQIPHTQTKQGNKVTIKGSDTLVGSCVCLDECVKNLVRWSGCTLAQAVRCVTENVADMMGVEDRGHLREGARADFVVLNDDGEVLQTWVAGKKVWERDQQ